MFNLIPFSPMSGGGCSVFSRLLPRFSPAWGLDLRSIALVRIGFALIFLGNLWDRCQWGFLSLHYSKESLFPLEAFPTLKFSLLDGLSGIPLQVAFGLFGLVGLGMLVGYRTRLMSWLCFVVLMLLTARTPQFMEGAEETFRLYFLLVCFLPLGSRFSVDAYRAGRFEPVPRGLFCSFPVLLLVGMIGFMYFLNACEKSTKDAWQSADALRAVMGDVVSGKPLLHWLRGLDSGLIFGLGVLFTVVGEFVLGFLPFLALRFNRCKWGMVAGMVALHLAIWLLLDVGPFSPFLMTLSLIFLPGSVYDGLQRRFAWVRLSLPVSGPARPFRLSWGNNLAAAAVAVALVPILLGGNPILWKLPLPEGMLDACKRFQSRVSSETSLAATWRQFAGIGPFHSAVFVEVVSPTGGSSFYPDGAPLRGATEWEAAPGKSPGRFFYHHRRVLGGNAAARTALSRHLFERGVVTVHYWQYLWVYKKGQGWVSSRNLIASHGSKKWVGFHTYVPGERSVQSMHSFETAGMKWDDGLQLLFSGKEGQEFKFPKWPNIPQGIPLQLNLTTGPDFGIYTVFVNGARLATVDLYSPSVSRITVPVPSTFLDAEGVEFSFVCEGKSPVSTGLLLGANSFSWMDVAPSGFKPGDPP